MFKIKNITNDRRKFRVKKTAQGFLLRAGEEMVSPYEPIIDRPDVLKVTDLNNVQESEEKKDLEVSSKQKRNKKGDKK